MRRPALIATALGAVLITALTGPAALADALPPTVAEGADVSYPQCGSDLPERGDIAVVGVNAGTGTTTNPCLAAQLAWGDAPAADGAGRLADVYVNSADPGRLADWWPAADLTRDGQPVADPRGRCSGAEDAACAYVYGYSVALDDLRSRGVTRAGDRTWWLDVETMNTWSWNRTANLAALEGMTEAIRRAGGSVGIYSTPRQWSIIVGRAATSTVLAGTPSWVAGATTRRGAVADCRVAPFAAGGAVVRSQWVQGGGDHDVACTPGVTGTRPVVVGEPVVGGRLVADEGRWGPSGVDVQQQWLRDGAPIPGATGPTYEPRAADAGARISVRVVGRRLGVPSLTAESDAVAVLSPAAPGPVPQAQRFAP